MLNIEGIMRGILILIFSIFILGSCTSQPNEFQSWKESNGKIKVLSSIAMIDDIVKQVGGEQVSTLVLIKGELDPHSYQLVKGDDEKLAMADLIFCNGLGLEHGPSLREYLLTNPKSVCLGDAIRTKHPDQIIYLQKTADPHIWMDISLWSKTIPLIAEALSAKDPEHAPLYKQRSDELISRMLKEHRQMQELFQKIPEENRYLITSHDAFNYFARVYLASADERQSGDWQKRVAAPEGLAPESQLSTTDIRLILNIIKKHHISVIFPESNVSQASIRKLMDAGNEEGLKLIIANEPLYADAMGSAGSSGDTYLKMLQHNGEVIARHLNLLGEKNGQH